MAIKTWKKKGWGGIGREEKGVITIFNSGQRQFLPVGDIWPEGGNGAGVAKAQRKTS